MATLIVILLVINVLMLAFIIKSIFAVNSNVIDHSKKVEGFIEAYSKNFEQDQRIRKTTARVLDSIAKELNIT